jgi:hypothetical protein
MSPGENRGPARSNAFVRGVLLQVNGPKACNVGTGLKNVKRLDPEFAYQGLIVWKAASKVIR